jgi:hypothetical protein
MDDVNWQEEIRNNSKKKTIKRRSSITRTNAKRHQIRITNKRR